VREIDELAIFNDEAHHIHDRSMSWFKCIQDIHHQLLSVSALSAPSRPALPRVILNPVI
jgi:hypothetical protein